MVIGRKSIRFIGNKNKSHKHSNRIMHYKEDALTGKVVKALERENMLDFKFNSIH